MAVFDLNNNARQIAEVQQQIDQGYAHANKLEQSADEMAKYCRHCVSDREHEERQRKVAACRAKIQTFKEQIRPYEDWLHNLKLARRMHLKGIDVMIVHRL